MDAISTVRSFFEYMHAKNIDAWADLWHNDARIIVEYQPQGFPPLIEGREQIIPGFRQLFSNFETYDYEITALYETVDANRIIVEWNVAAKLKSNGDVYEGNNITVFILRDGKIFEYHDYFNPEKFAKVVDQLPS